jgi:cysteinyl-tRNA synthetase
MSKSLGNFVTIRDALESHTADALRLYLLQTHYRSPLEFGEDGIVEAQGGIARMYETLQRAGVGAATALRDVGGVLGILQREPGKALAADREARAAAAGLSDAQIDALLDERIAARKARDFKRADEIRGRLADAGIDLKDNPDRTTTWAARR